MTLPSYIARLGMLVGVALLNAGIVLWLFLRGDGQSGGRVAIETIGSALLLICLALLLHIW